MMRDVFKKHWRFLVVVLAIFGLILWRYSQGDIEQDNYVEYAEALGELGSTGELQLNYNDTRLMPGLPLLILLISQLGLSLELAGYAVVVLSVIGSYWGLSRLEHKDMAVWALVFPPILLEQASIIATEWVMVAFLLFGLLMAREKRWFVAGVLLGLGVWVRLTMLAVLGVVGLWLLYQRKVRELGYFTLASLMPIVLLLVFNTTVFGAEGALHQLNVYPEYSRATLAVVQLVRDIPRAIEWGWWRQVISGFFYLGFLMWGVKHGYEWFANSASEAFKRLIFLLSLGLTLFVFSVGPTPFLEEFARFLVPVFVLLWMFFPKGEWQRWWTVSLALSVLVVVV